MEREDWLNSTDPREAAAAWHALASDGELREIDRTAFADWLRKSPTHLEEYVRLSALREQLRAPGLFAGISLDDLKARIGTNVEVLDQAPPATHAASASSRPAGQHRNTPPSKPQSATSSAPSGRAGRARWGWGAALAASITLVCALGWFVVERGGFSVRPSPADVSYSTAVGEQRSIVLSDGSIAELNTRSQVRVQFSAHAREIFLGDGEASFTVAKEPGRPFVVYSGAAVVQAVGTQFNVRHDAGRTTVTVVEGRVSVGRSQPTPASQASSPRAPGTERGTRIELSAGQRLAVAESGAVDAAAVQRVDSDTALAWKSRRLVFDDLQLDAVVAEFNRYNTRQILLDDAHLQTRSITGVFNANDPDSFVTFLERAQGVGVRNSGAGDIVISRASPSR